MTGLRPPGSQRSVAALGGKPSGRVLPPHVFAGVTNDLELAREEIFGPVAPVIRAHGEDEALRLANGNAIRPDGRGLYSRSRSWRALCSTDAG
jgi:acyl-CoA reductase-like NAD-dependent aldehyde dehydrogenase